MIEKAGVLYFRFFCYLYVLFSFVLIQKKKYQKENAIASIDAKIDNLFIVYI